jgi:GntR family transcriptional regulator, rspAB operon transcriptional repressor
MSAELAPGAGRLRASDAAYARLRDEIIDWTLVPGTPLGEIETAARLGVSRTPLREALSRLSAEGLVVNVGRTSRVAPLSRRHVVELFELREALETQAARLAARRRVPAAFEELRTAFAALPGRDRAIDLDHYYALAARLDTAIDAAADSGALRSALRDLRGQLQRARRSSHDDRERLEHAAREHVLIVEAILAGDELLAAQATAVHLHASLQHILAALPED